MPALFHGMFHVFCDTHGNHQSQMIAYLRLRDLPPFCTIFSIASHTFFPIRSTFYLTDTTFTVYSSLIPGAERHRIVNSKESNMSIHVVVMGVAGCGKSTVAEAIHERLGYVYAEGDDFHPQANIDKMSAGIPLTDEDRWPWLNVINSWMVAREALGENTVVSSSALKRSYREVLAKDVPTFFIHLNGSHELIQQRLSERKGHFMPPALLPSQFAILEPLVPEENGVEISIEGSVDEMVDRAIEALNAYAATVAAQTATQAA
jgi:gluconokinase